MDDKSFHVRIPKRWARMALIVATTALIVAPLTAIASHSFTDVPSSNTFHADIAWLADAGVTKGCNPPANTEFCPDDNVSRGQMSAFMRRFAVYIDAEDGTPGLADHATTAGDADTVDGKDASDFLGVNDKAADSDKLDGLDSSEILFTAPVATIWMDLPNDIKFAEGIEEVTSPNTGVFCLRLASDLGLTNPEIFAHVTVEWGDSFGSDLLAYWQGTNQFGCPDIDQVEIRTYDFIGGSATLSNDVAFVASIYQRPEGISVLSISGTQDSGAADNAQ